MDTKENEKLLALTKLIGRKDLSEGLVFEMYDIKFTFRKLDINNCIRDGIESGDVNLIGHPLLLSDILNGLRGKQIQFELSGNCIDIYKEVWHSTEDDMSWNEIKVKPYIIDLSLPLFSSQSEDFKTFIYEVFNIK